MRMSDSESENNRESLWELNSFQDRKTTIFSTSDNQKKVKRQVGGYLSTCQPINLYSVHLQLFTNKWQTEIMV